MVDTSAKEYCKKLDLMTKDAFNCYMKRAKPDAKEQWQAAVKQQTEKTVSDLQAIAGLPTSSGMSGK